LLTVATALLKRTGERPLQASPRGCRFDDPLEAARPLRTTLKELDQDGSRPGTGAGFSFLSSNLPIGDVVLSRFSGGDLRAQLNSDSLACFLLPDGWIGQQAPPPASLAFPSSAWVGYLPPCEAAASNSLSPAGTLIRFSLLNLQRRLVAINGDAAASGRPHPALLQARTIPLQSPRDQFLVAAVLDVLRLVDEAVHVTAAPPPAALALDDLLLRSIGLLLAPQPPPPQTSCSSLERAVDRAMDWMRTQLRRPISLADVEKQVGYGRRSLQCGFQRRVGCGPMQWLRQQRLEEAHVLIRAIASGASAQRLSLQQVASQCGYGNLSSFSRDFSSLYGYPPSRLLRNRS
jgi:AraC-like DNA-binding protein